MLAAKPPRGLGWSPKRHRAPLPATALPVLFEVPKLSLWIDVAKVLWKFVVLDGAEKRDFKNLAPMVNVELEFSDR